MMLGTNMLRDTLGVYMFTLGGIADFIVILKTQIKSLNRFAGQVGHDRGHQTGINSAADKCTKWYIRHQH